MSSFLDSVNEVLKQNTIISGDDDDITTFNNTQHRASLNLARNAIRSTLSELIADRLIPYEQADGTITYVTDQRTYSLPGDFVRFVGTNPFLLELDSDSNSANIVVPFKPEEEIRKEIWDYRSQSGSPIWFYEVKGTTKKIGLYQVPDSSKNEFVVRFPYEKDVQVSNSTDTMPFTTESEFIAFNDMAARYFQFLFTKQPIIGLEKDLVYNRAKSTLMQLMRMTNPTGQYGYVYR